MAPPVTKNDSAQRLAETNLINFTNDSLEQHYIALQTMNVSTVFVKEIQKMKARDTHIEFDFLKKGEYRMYIEVKWNEETEEEHRVVHATCYG